MKKSILKVLAFLSKMVMASMTNGLGWLEEIQQLKWLIFILKLQQILNKNIILIVIKNVGEHLFFSVGVIIYANIYVEVSWNLKLKSS